MAEELTGAREICQACATAAGITPDNPGWRPSAWNAGLGFHATAPHAHTTNREATT